MARKIWVIKPWIRVGLLIATLLQVNSSPFDGNGERVRRQAAPPAYDYSTTDDEGLEARAGKIDNPDYTFEFFEPEPDPNEPFTEITPYAFPNNKVSKGYGEQCQFYGTDFILLQVTSEHVSKKIEEISAGMCKLALRLECVPLSQQPATTAVPTNKKRRRRQISNQTQTRHGPKKTHGRNRTQGTKNPLGGRSGDDETTTLVPIGKCVCSRTLGDRAVYIKGDKKSKGGCFIPAGFELASSCDHEIGLPYGDMDNGTFHRKTIGKSSNLCVPNAECRTGDDYIGQRCMCKEDAKWIRVNGTCKGPARGNDLKSSGYLTFVYFLICTASYVFTLCNYDSSA